MYAEEIYFIRNLFTSKFLSVYLKGWINILNTGFLFCKTENYFTGLVNENSKK
jgi:hypothetical protein